VTSSTAVPGQGNRIKHPRSLLGQIRMVLLQPGLFFRTLPTTSSQHWILAAFLILALVGFSAIRQQELISGSGSVSFSPPPDTSAPPDDFSGGQSDGLSQNGTAAAPDISMTWKPALTASSEIVVNWLLLSVLLIIVSVSRSGQLKFGLNVRIAVWSSVPLGLMAALQLLYYSSGGAPGKPGLSGIVVDLPAYKTLPSIWQLLLVSLSSRLTVFWLWSLILLYLGARNALGGMRIVVLLVIALWIAWLVLVPAAITGLTAQSTEIAPTLMPLSDGP
jgi:hypothetical protein